MILYYKELNLNIYLTHLGKWSGAITPLLPIFVQQPRYFLYNSSCSIRIPCAGSKVALNQLKANCSFSWMICWCACCCWSELFVSTASKDRYKQNNINLFGLFFFFLKIISLFLYVLCVVDFVVIAAGVVGREGAGLTGAGVAVTVAGVVGTEEDTVTAGAVAVTGVAFWVAFGGGATVDTVSITLIKIQAFGP